MFGRACTVIGAGGCGYRPYSLRRGGATAFYRRTASMDQTIERGRWSTAKVARLYICDGLATAMQICHAPELRARWRAQAVKVKKLCKA